MEGQKISFITSREHKSKSFKKSLYIPTEITKICNKIKGKEKQPINPHDFQHSSRECDVDRKK